MCRGGDCVEYPVLYQGEQAGQVTLTARGGQVQAVVSCRRDNTGLFRAYLLCEKGEYPLGVLEPRGSIWASGGRCAPVSSRPWGLFGGARCA